MDYKKIIAYINGENEVDTSIINTAKKYSDSGADEIYIYNYTQDEVSREEFLHTLKKVKKEIEVPLIVGLYVERFDDIKKAFYVGAEKVVVKNELIANNEEVIEEGIKRFGTDKVFVELHSEGDFSNWEITKELKEKGFAGVLLKHVEISGKLKENLKKSRLPIIIRDSLVRNIIEELIVLEQVDAVATNYYKEKDMNKVKRFLEKEGICVHIFKSNLKFSQFKLNSDGLVPVVTQDYKTGEVLMVAYMNEEAYEKTIETGQMHYFSRSRQELWHKGKTSGHYQYVKHLLIDCDNDTILAKVKQVGAACHTGSRSCFYTELIEKTCENKNPFMVFNEVYNVIKDRKINPKEGSYTNYLFNKGIDKILKKCGEEATEMVIAAKNPGAEELKYEIADFLYHMMVLMVEQGLDWEDITEELSQR